MGSVILPFDDSVLSHLFEKPPCFRWDWLFGKPEIRVVIKQLQDFLYAQALCRYSTLEIFIFLVIPNSSFQISVVLNGGRGFANPHISFSVKLHWNALGSGYFDNDDLLSVFEALVKLQV